MSNFTKISLERSQSRGEGHWLRDMGWITIKSVLKITKESRRCSVS